MSGGIGWVRARRFSRSVPALPTEKIRVERPNQTRRCCVCSNVAGGAVGVPAHDVEAIETVDDFCHAEYGRLYGTLRLYCNDPWLAEELAQEALARVVHHWARVQEMDAPGAWLHRVAINLANSSFRRRAAERRATGRARMARESHEDPDSPSVVAVRKAVQALPARQREVVILRYFHDLSVKTTAARMDCTEGNVKGLLSDAIRSLRARGFEVDADA